MHPTVSRVVGYVSARCRMRFVGLRNRIVSKPAVMVGGPVVSLTSFGVRIANVHLAIESIASGEQRPSRIILWLDDADAVAHPSPGLVRLQRRGLEIRHCADYGPHKKYYPYVASVEQHVTPMATADDDVLYPRTWLSALTAAHARHPDAVVAHRADEIAVVDGEVAPYRTWTRAVEPRCSPRHLAVGVKGVLYPPALLRSLRAAGPAFMDEAPGSSDFWLHHMTLLDGRGVVPVHAFAPSAVVPFRGVPDGPTLMDVNVHAGRNDRVGAAVFSPAELAAIVADDLGALNA